MKRRKNGDLLRRIGICAGAAAVSAALLTGCDWFRPERNETPAVYGPPEYFEEDFDPAGNEPQDVYGPPPIGEDFDPAQELPAPVYGPPEWYEPLPTEEPPEETP